MNNNNNANVLISHLKQEITWVEELNKLLTEEQEILAKRQFDRLEKMADKKQVLSAALEESSKKRISLLKSENNQSISEALKKFLTLCSSEETTAINSLNTNLMNELDKCRNLNIINGQVIANNLYSSSKIIDALSGNKKNTVNTYTATGDIKSTITKDGGRHQEA